jgi:hypothetical protein
MGENMRIVFAHYVLPFLSDLTSRQTRYKLTLQPTEKRNKMLSSKTIRANLRNVYRAANENQITAGTEWYFEGESFVRSLALRSGHTPEQIATVVAHLSPRQSWVRNKAMTVELVETGTTRGLGACIARATNALNHSDPLSTLNGPKTRSFGLNLLGRYETVTVDVWAYRAACPSGNIENMGAKEYALISDAYIATAKYFGITPAQFQAIVWVAIRGKAE